MSSKFHPSQWKYPSPESFGFHEVITPDNSPCKLTWVYRLNLAKGSSHVLHKEDQELNGVVIAGSVTLSHKSGLLHLDKRDSFFLPGNDQVQITAKADSILFIGGSLFEGKGQFFSRRYDLSMPIGDIHQIHGKPPYKREVFMTLAQQDEASRLICGITIGEEGKWTSWPPHQHTKDLEEVYCFFDIPKPKAAFHFSGRQSGEYEHIHAASSGDCIVIPEGYHPTCGMPGVKSSYFWIMAAHQPKSRRYDLAVNDPHFE